MLPIVLVLIAVAAGEAGGAGEWLSLLGRLFVVGPAVGFAIGGAGSWLVFEVDRRMEIRREYQALFGLGLVLASFAAGQLIADGFLAAFAAGLAVVVLNRELCDCFFEYGEITSETAMLLAFVLFGAVLSNLVPTVPLGAGLAFALLVICVARPVAITVVLARVPLDTPARAFLAWFGPRGLSSLLLALLAVLNGVAEGEALLAMTGVVVITSVVLHGASATPVAAWYARLMARRTLPEERESTAAGLFGGKTAAGDKVPRITPAELAAALAGDDPPVVLDVRSRSQYAQDAGQIPGERARPGGRGGGVGGRGGGARRRRRRGRAPPAGGDLLHLPARGIRRPARRQLRTRGWETAARLGATGPGRWTTRRSPSRSWSPAAPPKCVEAGHAVHAAPGGVDAEQRKTPGRGVV